MNRTQKQVRPSRPQAVSRGWRSRWTAWIWVVMGVALGASLSGAWIHRQHSASVREVSAAGLYCDSGIGAAKAHGRSMVTASGGAPGAPPITPINWTQKSTTAQKEASTQPEHSRGRGLRNGPRRFRSNIRDKGRATQPVRCPV